VSSAPSFAAQAAGTVVALVLVLGLAWVCLALLRRMQVGAGGWGRAPGAGSPAKVLGSVVLGPRERVVTVRWQGRDYLLGVTPAAINVIDQREAAPEVVAVVPTTPAVPPVP
jgi:flagellar protein FliO/FliZ